MRCRCPSVPSRRGPGAGGRDGQWTPGTDGERGGSRRARCVAPVHVGRPGRWSARKGPAPLPGVGPSAGVERAPQTDYGGRTTRVAVQRQEAAGEGWCRIRARSGLRGGGAVRHLGRGWAGAPACLAQAIAGAWRRRPWPGIGLRAYTVLAADDGTTMLHFSEVDDLEDVPPQDLTWKQEVDAAVPGIERVGVASNVLRCGTPVHGPAAEATCVVLATRTFDSPDAARADRLWMRCPGAAPGCRRLTDCFRPTSP